MRGSEAGRRRKRVRCIKGQVAAVDSWGSIPGGPLADVAEQGRGNGDIHPPTPICHWLQAACRVSTLQQARPWTKQGPVTRASNAYNGKTINAQILKTSAGWQA